MRDPAEVALAFDRAARVAGVPYALIGGLAVSAWGQPRATQDVDVLVSLPEGGEIRFCDALRAERLQARPADFVAGPTERSHVTIHDERSEFHVDCKVARTSEEHDQVGAAKDLAFGAGRLRIARAEDTIAYKVLFGSPQDLQDVRSIVVRQAGRLDLGRLREVARRLGVREAVEQILSQGEP